MSEEEQEKKDPEWYISDMHTRRAVRYLGAKLFEDGYLSASEIDQHLLMRMWDESLEQTTLINEPSPIGPDPEQARKFLMSTMNARVDRLEERADNIEAVIMSISDWLLKNNTRYNWGHHQKVEKTLYGTETTSEARPDPAS